MFNFLYRVKDQVCAVYTLHLVIKKKDPITMTSLWARWRLKSPAFRLFVQPFVQTQIKEISKLRFTGLCEGNPLVTGGFPSQRTSNAENISIWCISTLQCTRPIRPYATWQSFYYIVFMAIKKCNIWWCHDIMNLTVGWPVTWCASTRDVKII